MSDSQAQLDDAIARANALPPQPTSQQLALYGLFKQASLGDVMGSRPSAFDLRGRAKWDAWAKHRGMSEAEATEAYSALVDRLARGN